MKKRFIRIIAPCALLCAAIALTGCLRFENSFDLSTPVTTGGGIPNNDVSVTGDPATLTPDAQEPSANVSENGSTAPSGSDSTDTTDRAGNPVATTAQTGVTGTNDATTASGGENATSDGGSAQTIAQYIRSLGTTEYDTLRSDAMTVDGIFGDSNGESAINMSLGNGDVYMMSEMDGLTMGIYISSNKTYIYLPSQKKYLKLNAAVAKLMGVDPNEFSDMTVVMGFDNLPPLTNAQSMSDGTMNNKACKLFLVKSNSGKETLRVGLNGKKLIGVEYLDGTGKVLSYMYFNSVTPGFPKMPPDGYTEMGYLEFFKLVMAEME